MAPPQLRLKDVLRKIGAKSSEMDEYERADMIRRLKYVKDPVERDRIIWALEGRKKDEHAEFSPAKEEEKPLAIDTQPAKRAPGTQVSLQTKIGELMGYLIPAFFVFFGLTRIIQAIGRMSEKGAERNQIFMELFVGALFIVFAISALFANKLKKKMGDSGSKPFPQR